MAIDNILFVNALHYYRKREYIFSQISDIRDTGGMTHTPRGFPHKMWCTVKSTSALVQLLSYVPELGFAP